MQIVIDIPDSAYKVCYDLRNVGDTNCLADILVNAVGVGTVLPKHGRLIDADALDKYSDIADGDDESLWVIEKAEIDNAPTILESNMVEPQESE